MESMDEENAKPLVLVVGAGASHEVNLPLGSELTRQIARVADTVNGGVNAGTGPAFQEALQYLASTNGMVSTDELNMLRRTCRHIRDAMPQAPSIDNFINTHRDKPRIAPCAKLAIARAILLAEEQSALMVDRNRGDKQVDFNSVSRTWFDALFQRINVDCLDRELPSRLSKIAIINFNYDRCLEHYLHASFMNYFRLTEGEATETISHLQIHHPYGKVGDLPWQTEMESIAFGGSPSGPQLLSLSQQLRTFHEGVSPETSDIDEIRRLAREAEQLVFLGFAYHQINLDLLFDPESQVEAPRRIPRIYGTAYGMSASDVDDVRKTLNSRLKVAPEAMAIRSDLTCGQLFSEYHRSLSLPR